LYSLEFELLSILVESGPVSPIEPAPLPLPLIIQGSIETLPNETPVSALLLFPTLLLPPLPEPSHVHSPPVPKPPPTVLPLDVEVPDVADCVLGFETVALFILLAQTLLLELSIRLVLEPGPVQPVVESAETIPENPRNTVVVTAAPVRATLFASNLII
jgi:hypothetical protein